MRALVLGGAECLWDDLEALGPWRGLIIATNDAGWAYPHQIDHWVSLHPETFPVWEDKRKGPGEYVTWGPRWPEIVDRVFPQPVAGGSTGMYAVDVALEVGADEVVLAGVPMGPAAHFNGEEPWKAFGVHRPIWEQRAVELRPVVTSCSGWTRKLFGPPTELQPVCGEVDTESVA